MPNKIYKTDTVVKPVCCHLCGKQVAFILNKDEYEDCIMYCWVCAQDIVSVMDAINRMLRKYKWIESVHQLFVKVRSSEVIKPLPFKNLYNITIENFKFKRRD